MSNIVLEAENISKQYRLGEIGTGTLSHDLNRFWARIRGKDDPFLQIGETNDRSKKGESDYVWALKDINFKIEQGNAVGIIGRNGAGKSTLLKLLSKVTAPTTGDIKVKGRIASLLEVGTGFHPEMTGKENIFLNGAILGMTKKEIKRKFDEIVDFSGVERYIDTPVKRYSSGMYVRLAFAVAAHLESEVLIVDEVLAVGDAEFQKKCLGKMGDVSKGEGRTILFVSHNMGAISSLCQKGILLENGTITTNGEIQSVIDYYSNSQKFSVGHITFSDIKFEREYANARILNIKTLKGNNITDIFFANESVKIEMEYEVLSDGEWISPSFHIHDNLGNVVFATFNGPSACINEDSYYGKELKKGIYRTSCIIPPFFLNTQMYLISAFLVPRILSDLTIAREVLQFTIEDTIDMRKEYFGTWIGLTRPKLEWDTMKIS